MKYLFILVLLIVAGLRGLMVAVIGYRWVDNMTETARVDAGRAGVPDAGRRGAAGR